MNRSRHHRHQPDPNKPPSDLAGWLAHKGSSLGTHLNSVEELLELGAIDARGSLQDLNEEQAETVRRLALAALVTIRQSLEGPKEDPR